MQLLGTTICAVKIDGRCAIAGDGQITLGQSTILKGTAKKVRRIFHDTVVIGFAGGVADAFALSERFEAKLEQYNSLERAAVELALEWRADKALRQLNATMLAADNEKLLLISGTGEVIEPDDGIIAIGSGGMYALSAARALRNNTQLDPAEIARKSLEIASEICVFTNSNIVVEEV